MRLAIREVYYTFKHKSSPGMAIVIGRLHEAFQAGIDTVIPSILRHGFDPV